jgi:hypothetical protein
MARDDDGDKPWTRQLLVAVGALAAVALVVGGVVSAFALGAAKVSGISDSGSRPAASASPSLYIPPGEPTTDVDPYPAPSSSGSASATPSASATAAPRPRPKPITLQAGPLQVGAGQRITLSGGYARGDGGSVQVQRFEAGAWADFPVTASVSGGRFSTYITTSRTGPTRLRVLDKATGKASNVVRVTVG